MRRWWQVGTRNWRAKPVRTALAVSAIALGVMLVTWVTCCYESGRASLTEMVTDWIGRAQVSVESVAGRWQLFEASVAAGLERVPNVKRLTTRTIETVDAHAVPRADGESHRPGSRLDLVGIDAAHELEFRPYPITAGRMLRPDDTDGVLLEELLAREWEVGVGDAVELHHRATSQPARRFTVIGLVDRRRVSSYQLPMAWASLATVQALSEFPGKIKAIDLILADDSEAAISQTADAVRQIVRERDRTLKVNTTVAQLRQLRAAQSQLQFVLMLVSCVALLTAFFIILSTMSMGVNERVAQLGTLRCLGVTRGQLLAMVLFESMPMGVLGVALGVPMGVGLLHITLRLVPEYVGRIIVSPAGIGLAVAGGLVTPLLGAAGPAIWAALLSPIAATRVAPTRHTARVELMAAAAGAALLVLNWLFIGAIGPDTPHFAALAVTGLVCLYAGYTLIAPLVIVLVGSLGVTIAARVLCLRRQLVHDQIGRRPWRSGAVCCGIMVGLSMIVAVQVHNESTKAGWQFPTEFPEAMVYSWSDVPLERMRAAARLPGVRDATIAADISCKLITRRRGFLSVLDPFYRLIAGDPDTFPKLIKLVYLEGTEVDALARLRRGGAVLVTREFSQARKIHVNDRVTLEIGDVRQEFDVAGVVASPALDIAVSFFGAGGEFQVYAVGSFIGTLADAKRLFGKSSARLLLFNFDLPDEKAARADRAFGGLHRRPGATVAPRPGDPATQPTGLSEAAVGQLRAAAEAAGTSMERQVANQIIDALRSPDCAYVTARQLKQQIDDNIDEATLLISAIPAVGLVVAALGVANLMMANVAHRMRQIAVLRAVGATKFQIARLVIAEALILGLIGCALGVIMGVHQGVGSNYVTHALCGFQPQLTIPWPMVATGAGLALGLCLLAGVGPARVASRDNIVAVLQSA
ncbi:MAG: FtsX-like permease family protein [Phycisphaerae bacterium]